MAPHGLTSEEQLLAAARQAGIDLDLIDTNLALPVSEQWRQHDAALALILKLQEAKAAHDAELHRADR